MRLVIIITVMITSLIVCSSGAGSRAMGIFQRASAHWTYILKERCFRYEHCKKAIILGLSNCTYVHLCFWFRNIRIRGRCR